MPKKKQESTKEYELLNDVNFGLLENDNGRALPEDKQPDPHGLVPAGETVSLPEQQGEELVLSGSAKPAGEDSPVGLNHDNPEEHGYQGEAERDAPESPEENKQ